MCLLRFGCAHHIEEGGRLFIYMKIRNNRVRLFLLFFFFFKKNMSLFAVFVISRCYVNENV